MGIDDKHLYCKHQKSQNKRLLKGLTVYQAVCVHSKKHKFNTIQNPNPKIISSEILKSCYETHELQLHTQYVNNSIDQDINRETYM